MEVLELSKEVLGLMHPQTILAMENIAQMRNYLGRYAEAEEEGIEVLELRKEAPGLQHPDTIQAMANHPQTILAMANIAQMRNYLGRHADAEKAEIEVLQLRKEALDRCILAQSSPWKT